MPAIARTIPATRKKLPIWVAHPGLSALRRVTVGILIMFSEVKPVGLDLGELFSQTLCAILHQ
jgi:hypothetical protein